MLAKSQDDVNAFAIVRNI